jgi:hypothetical protein
MAEFLHVRTILRTMAGAEAVSLKIATLHLPTVPQAVVQRLKCSRLSTDAAQ